MSCPRFRHEVGQRLAMARKRAGLSRAELGRRALESSGAHSAIGRWEFGLYCPSFESATRMARVLGVTMEWLSGEGERDDLDSSGSDRADTHTAVSAR